MRKIERIIQKNLDNSKLDENNYKKLDSIYYKEDTNTQEEIDVTNLSEFPDLESIYLVGLYVTNTNILNKLPKLTNLTCRIKEKEFPIINPDILWKVDFSNSYFIESLKNLKYYKNIFELNLNNNNVEEISLNTEVATLYSLFLEKNILKNINGVTNFSNLLFLNIKDNFISNLESLENLSKLSVLRASRNRINKVPIIKELDFIELDENPLEDITGITEMKKLSSVSLNECGISSLQGIESKSVMYLEIKDNWIDNSNDFLGFSNLVYLDCRNNRISSVNFIKNLSQLQNVKLSGNRISNIEGIVSMRIQNEKSKDPSFKRIINIENQQVLSEGKNISDDEYYRMSNIIKDDEGNYIIPKFISADGVYDNENHIISWNKKHLFDLYEYDPYQMEAQFEFIKTTDCLEIRYSGLLIYSEMENAYEMFDYYSR